MRHTDFLPHSENGLLPPEATPGIPLDEYDFDRLLVYLNPTSENAGIARLQVADLEQSRWGHLVDLKETVPGGHEANQEEFAKHLREGDILVLATGDGTQKIAVQTLSSNIITSDKICQTPILPLGGGRACDLDAMLNDSRHRIAPSDILADGRIVSINAARTVLESQHHEPYEHFAASYVTVGGVTAKSAHVLNSRQYRESRLHKIPGLRTLHETAVVGRALSEASTFTVEQDDIERDTLELLFINGWRMAKYCRFPSRLTDRAIFHAEISDKHVGTVAKSIGGLLTSRLVGDFLADDYSFTLKTPTWIQFDGEAEPVHADTRITIRPADVAFRAITTRVHP